MKKSRFTTDQINGFIKQAEACMAVEELARQHSLSPASFYTWRGKCGGMEGEDAMRLIRKLQKSAVEYDERDITDYLVVLYSEAASVLEQ